LERAGFKLVKLVWHGHACFELQGKNVTVIIDPFKGIGIPEPKAAANIVLCSHSHQDHNNVKPVLAKQGETLEGFEGSKKMKGIAIRGIAAFHDDTKGSKRGKNSIYTFNLDGVQFCHLGDLGHELSAQMIEEIGKVDVLFVPVGGYFTIGPETAMRVCEQLKPKMIIPMHYKLPGLASSFNALKTVDDFVRGKSNTDTIKGPAVNIEELNLPKEPRILVLSLK
jgi:L-ascorbate metabolism protein UlaG (beta-lactamase superfamily)